VESQSAVGSLMDYGARFYSPALGRFISADSVVPQPENPQNLNRYAYTLNNPLKYVDPTGHDVGCAGRDATACSGWHRSWSGEFTLWNWLYENSSWKEYGGALSSYYHLRASVASVALEDGTYSDRMRALQALLPAAREQLTLFGYYGQAAANQSLWNNMTPDILHGVAAGTTGVVLGAGGIGSPANNLPAFVRGGKTVGILNIGNSQEPLVSGRNGPASDMSEDAPGMTASMAIRDHVEAHAAARMRQTGANTAELWINNPNGPCQGPMGCDSNLPHMLSENASLTVHWPDGMGGWNSKTYVGLPDSQWGMP
jgi:RHS repeat-associated protein